MWVSLKDKHRGQMMIEVVVALGIITLVLVGVSDLMTRSLRVVSYQKQKDEANSIIQKTLNDYKLQRDSDPVNFYDTVAGATIDPCVIGKPYKCIVTVGKTEEDIAIKVTVEWNDGGKVFNTDSSIILIRTVK